VDWGELRYPIYVLLHTVCNGMHRFEKVSGNLTKDPFAPAHLMKANAEKKFLFTDKKVLPNLPLQAFLKAHCLLYNQLIIINALLNFRIGVGNRL